MYSVWKVPAAAGMIVMLAASGPVMAADKAAAADPALDKRLAEEKEARRACKVEICKAFAEPGAGDPVACSFTKTWRRQDILERIVGGSYVWGYGHMQCTTSVKLDKERAGKALREDELALAIGKHELNCAVEHKDASKGEAFKVRVSLAPTALFKKGKIESVDFGPVETDGSRVAAAALTSAMAINQLSGVISRAAADEMNNFLFENCNADGVPIKPPS